MFFRVLVAFVVLFTSVHSFADTCTTNLYFINGVGYSTERELKTINGRLSEILKLNSSVCVKPPLFNRGNGLISDLSETFALKFLSENGIGSSFVNLVQGWLLETIQLTINLFRGDTPQDPEIAKQLNEMTAIVKKDVNNGKKVILVGHSEGNLFAKEITKRINSGVPVLQRRVTHLGVAVPTIMSSEPPFSGYVTSSTDVVINGALRFNQTEPSTFTSSSTGGTDGLRHNFLDSYLNENHLGRPGFANDPRTQGRAEMSIKTFFVLLVKRAEDCLALTELSCGRI